MARDPLELRAYAPTVPDDLNDPPRFGQLCESVKDAFVLGLRGFFRSQNLTLARREEAPTVAKYAIEPGAGLDPYETFTKIVEEFPDVRERLPHVAVTNISGSNKKLTAGRPLIGQTQAPPRVATTNPGPYALSNPQAEVVDITVLALPPGTYTVTVNSIAFPVTLLAGSATEVLLALKDVLRPLVDLLIEVTVSGPTMRLRGRILGEAFTISVSANLLATTISTASAVSAPDVLLYRTAPLGVVHESRVEFSPSRFATPGTASAADIARVINEQALYGHARTVAVGAGLGVQLECGGVYGSITPNEIEILPGSTPALLTALGLADFGSAAAAVLGGEAPTMTLTIAGAFSLAMAGRYLQQAGATNPGNNGRFLILAATVNQLTFVNENGVAEILPASATWFVGYRDDWKNIARPVQHRYHMAAQLEVTVDVLAESPTERKELFDLVWSYFTFYMEQQHFEYFGRSVFDETVEGENYQIIIHQEVRNGGEQEQHRGEDAKNGVHSARIGVPVTAIDYIDRAVTVLSGPHAGETWTPSEIGPDFSLPLPS